MRRMQRTKNLRRNKQASRNRVFIFTSGGLVTALFLVLVLVSLENPSGGTGSISVISPDPTPPPVEKDPKTVQPTVSEESPLTFYNTLTRDDPEGDSAEGFGMENFDPLTPAPYGSGETTNIEKGYTIQVAALGSKATAEDLAKRLRRKGFASHILPLSVPNRGTLYRVRIGGFNTLKEAEKWVGHLKQEEGLSPFIAKDKG